MRATVMFEAGDVRIENVPDPENYRTNRRSRHRYTRLHLRKRSLALQQNGTHRQRSHYGP